MGQEAAVVRLSPEKGTQVPWMGRHMGTPCLLMRALSSTSPAPMKLASCRVPLHLCPWELGLGATGLSQGKELSSLGGASDCQPSRGHSRSLGD